MEQAVVTAVTHDTSEAKVTVTGVPDQPGIAARCSGRWPTEPSTWTPSCRTPRCTARPTSPSPSPRPISPPASKVAAGAGPRDRRGRGRRRRRHRQGVLVGAGMRSHPGVSATMFEILANAGINIEMISTSSIRLSCVVGPIRRGGGPVRSQGVRARAPEHLLMLSGFRPGPDCQAAEPGPVGLGNAGRRRRCNRPGRQGHAVGAGREVVPGRRDPVHGLLAVGGDPPRMGGL